MILYLTNEDVMSLLTLNEAITAVEHAMARLGRGETVNRPRQRIALSHTTLNVMAAADSVTGFAGVKIYATGSGVGGVAWLHLIDRTGRQRAIVESARLSQLRTGAATAVATRYLSRVDSRVVGMLGSGMHAESQLEAVSLVRPIGQARVWSPNAERLKDSCNRWSGALGVAVKPAQTPYDAVEGADVIITITRSQNPVFRGEWLYPGQHLNAVGSNSPASQEIDEEAVGRADCIVVDSLEQAKVESGDLITAEKLGRFRWDQAVELSDVVVRGASIRSTEGQITLFESHGIALWDLTVAMLVYNAALERGVGRPIDVG